MRSGPCVEFAPALLLLSPHFKKVERLISATVGLSLNAAIAVLRWTRGLARVIHSYFLQYTMIGIFNCGGGDHDYYDNDYEDSLYGGGDDMTLRQYRGRAERPSFDVDDRSATEKEMAAMPSVEELGDNLRALAMRRISSQRIPVNVGQSSGGRMAKRRGSAAMRSFGMSSGSHRQYPDRSTEYEHEEVVLTQVHTVRRPQSFLSPRQQQAKNCPADKTRKNVKPVFSKERHKTGIPKEICIEIQRESRGEDDDTDRREMAEERDQHERHSDCDREPVEFVNDCEELREESEESSELIFGKREAMADSNARGAAIPRVGMGAQFGMTRPPLPDAAKSKHVRVRIRKPLGIVFESLQEGSVRIVEMPMTGNAARSGTMQIWDELVSINAKSMKHRSFDFVMEQIAKADPSKKLDLVFRRRNAHANVAIGRDGTIDDKYEMPEY